MDTGLRGVIWYPTATPSDRMVNQELHDSCGAACARQLLRDNHVDVPESRIRELGRYDAAVFGMSTEDVADAINAAQQQIAFRAGAGVDEYLDLLLKSGPWIAFVAPHRGPGHMIIVDGIDFDRRLVSVRDPWGAGGPGSGSGLEASLDLDAFLELWRRGIHNAVWRIR
jgi:predicted double-glycine peptidase